MDKTNFPHECDALMILLRNFIIRLMERYGLEYRHEAFYKKFSEDNTIKIATLDEIMKGL